jgi:hypothetical protein
MAASPISRGKPMLDKLKLKISPVRYYYLMG